MNILGLAIAGALGTICRYEVGKFITYQQFPVATLLINMVGSIFLGFLFVKYATQQPHLFLIMGVGFCGGFTTFSTFSLDLFKMLQSQDYVNFVVYISLSITLGITGIFVGTYLAKWI